MKVIIQRKKKYNYLLQSMRCCGRRLSLSTLGCCCCCFTVPVSSQRLPKLNDQTKLLLTKSEQKNDDQHHSIQISEQYFINKNSSMPQECKQKRNITIVTISDSHMKHMRYNMPSADILIIAGDFTNWKTTETDVPQVMQWIASLNNKYEHVIIICGNHEISLHRMWNTLKQNASTTDDEKSNASTIAQLFERECGAIYLQDSFVTLYGLKFYGTPWHIKRGYLYKANAFEQPLKNIEQIFGDIPSDVDVLITHSPPFGICDFQESRRGNVGCFALLNNILERIQPIIHVFGHIHEGSGVQYIDECDTLFVNTACIPRLFQLQFISKEFDSNGVQNNNNVSLVIEEENI